MVYRARSLCIKFHFPILVWCLYLIQRKAALSLPFGSDEVICFEEVI